MKNLKIKSKLLVGFIVVAMLTTITGVFGIISLYSINNSYLDSFTRQTLPLPKIAYALEYVQLVRVNLREVVIYSDDSDNLMTSASHVRSNADSLGAYVNDFIGSLDSVADAALIEIAEEARLSLTRDFLPKIDELIDSATDGASQTELMSILESTTASANLIIEKLGKCMETQISDATSSNETNSANASGTITLMIAISVFSIIVAITSGFVIANMIASPVNAMKAAMQQVGETGNLEFPPDVVANLDKIGQGKDEVSQSMRALRALIMRITAVSGMLKTIAGGDLTGDIDVLSEHDELGASLVHMRDNLTRLFGEINSATDQVSTGSKQIASGAQALAQGATEQAAAVEQLSSSIGEISEKTNANAEMATKAAELSSHIRANAERGSEQMGEMMQAVRDINDASQSIGKVIKVIDDIAFQTNILALNAAVEAARAGQHGKGFAVVAEEVRSLAAKSAEAAKDTGGLIENSIEKAVLGAKIADATASSLNDIVQGINESTVIVSDIARSSEEQAAAISQVNTGIDQVAQVVQQNSATAQQSAAASQEMSGQSEMLTDLVAQFKLRDDGFRRTPIGDGRSSQRGRPSAPSRAVSDRVSLSDDFGKY